MRTKSRVINVVDSDYLYAHRISNFVTIPTKSKKPLPLTKKYLQTNFDIILNHPYVFILLHLKSTPQTKNKLNINIPQICIFHNHTLYDILYNQGEQAQQIKGMRNNQKVHLHKVYSLFLSRSKIKGIHKQQQCIACFQNEEYLLLSDTDLYINCHRMKGDPFFNKLIYIRNRLDLGTQTRIIVPFNGQKDLHYRGQAVQNFLGHKTDKQFLQTHTKDQYLKYLCQKIALFLNIQQNIRIKTANFIFALSTQKKYYLIDIQNLQYENLTLSIKRWQQKIKNKQEAIISKLVMNEEEYEKLQKKVNNQQVKIMEDEMNVKFNHYAERFKVKTEHIGVKESKRNQVAFDKLFPKYGGQMDKVIDSMTIKQLRKNVLNKPTRRKIVKPSTLNTAATTQYHSFRTSHSVG